MHSCTELRRKPRTGDLVFTSVLLGGASLSPGAALGTGTGGTSVGVLLESSSYPQK